MPLIRSVLTGLVVDALKRQLQDKNTPTAVPVPTSPAQSALADAYHAWVMSGFPTLPLTWSNLPSKKVLESFLAVPMFSGWAPGLSNYWAGATITGPGLFPSNPLDPSTVAQLPALSAQLTAGLQQVLVSVAQDKNETVEGSADKLSSKLFTFTTGLMYATFTISTPPVKAQVPVL